MNHSHSLEVLLVCKGILFIIKGIKTVNLQEIPLFAVFFKTSGQTSCFNQLFLEYCN